MPCVVQAGMFRPFDFNGRQPAAVFDDEVHFRTIAGALMVQFALPQILQPVPQLKAHPLFKDRARIRLYRFDGWNQSRRRVPDAQIEEDKLGR